MSVKNEVELKGGMYTFMSLKLNTADLSVIDERIADKIQQAPGFFKDSPVVVDLSGVEEAITEGSSFDTAELLERIRSHRLNPIVASVIDKSSPFASSIALPLMETGLKRSNKKNSTDNDEGDSKTGQESSSANGADQSLISSVPSLISGRSSNNNASHNDVKNSEDNSDAETEELALATEVEVVVKPPMLLTRPVRSGQQVFARDTDLIIMGQVGAGAEVLADQNIHVYGPLRGRALCGVSGNSNTRIFCQSLEAEMVSVDGVYRVLEDIPEELRGKPAQIWLDNGSLNIEPL